MIETTRQAHRGTYTSSHWDDIDNPLIHIRLKDRKGPNGERVLFIEEIQSDWHQAGRERGYARDTRGWTARSLPSTGFAKWQVLDADGNEVTTIIGGTEETAIREAASGNHVPSAPFKRTEDWLGLALRRVLDEAAQGGYTRVAWTTGAQQNRRYSLSQHVDHIEYDPDAERLRAWSDRTQDPEVDEEVSPDRLHEYIGRDAAERLLATRRRNLPTVADLTTGLPGQPNRGEPYGPHVLEGEDLEVGGNGMTTFYDEMIPRVLRDIAKKRGVEVPMGRHDADEAGLGVNTFGGARAQRTAEPLRGTQYIDVTPQLRERIRTRGQELYNLAPLAAGGAAAAAGAEDDKDGTNEAALSTVVGLGVMGAAGRRGQETIRRILKALPSAEHYQAAALAGQARRNWYTDSEKAIKTMFGDDAPLFTGLLAATSPRQQVPGNVRMTAELWAAWDAAGRPRDRRRVEALVNAYLPLPSHRNNAVRALIGEEVPRLSGSKVEPFRQNLSGNPEPVTNDAIMAATGRMNAGQLQGTRKTKDVVGRVTHSSPTYDAMQRRIQEAARALGGSWTPAEIQAATWSWARPELQGATRDLNPSLQSGGLHTPEDIDELPDFARLLVDNEHLQNYSLPAAPRAPRPDGRAPDPRLLADLVKNIRRSVLGQYF